mgnify:FL=1
MTSGACQVCGATFAAEVDAGDVERLLCEKCRRDLGDVAMAADLRRAADLEKLRVAVAKIRSHPLARPIERIGGRILERFGFGRKGGTP